jgi:MFS family permease
MKWLASPVVRVSFGMVVGVMGTALISPLYALYKEAWQLQTSDISLIYVLYMAGALCALLFAGRLPDRMGFRPLMQWGLALAMAGTLISLVAWNTTVLTIGRVIVGISSSIVMGSAASGLSKLAQPGQLQRMAVMNSFLLALGFGLGPLIGGVMGQWFPQPLVSAYVPTLVLGVLAMLAIRGLQLPDAAAPAAAVAPLHWRDVVPKLTWPAPDVARAFLLTTCLPFLAFGVFGMYASMAPLFLDKLVPWHGPVVSGSAIALILFISAAIQVMAARLPMQWCGFLGLLGLAGCCAVLMLNFSAGSATLFVLGVLLTAAGHGMSMLAGMRMLSRLATPANRAGLMSTYMVIGYLGSMVPMMGMGWIADHWGLALAVDLFCSFVVIMGTAAAVLFKRYPQMQATWVQP